MPRVQTIKGWRTLNVLKVENIYKFAHEKHSDTYSGMIVGNCPRHFSSKARI